MVTFNLRVTLSETDFWGWPSRILWIESKETNYLVLQNLKKKKQQQITNHEAGKFKEYSMYFIP